MGSLALPRGGLVYADAQIAIYAVEKVPKYSAVLQPLWSGAQAAEFDIVTSELTLMETLIVPYRNSDIQLEQDYENLWQHPNARLLPITQTVLREAARLRAAIQGLRTPDAIHAATAQGAGCSLFVTNDRGFDRMPGLSVAVLDDVIIGP